MSDVGIEEIVFFKNIIKEIDDLLKKSAHFCEQKLCESQSKKNCWRITGTLGVQKLFSEKEGNSYTFKQIAFSYPLMNECLRWVGANHEKMLKEVRKIFQEKLKTEGKKDE